uniref:Uncharacterized protein n=1 Tax=viral metagenome TaxID=1070528 RepID=A0A6M3JJX1_9ZZZZ
MELKPDRRRAIYKLSEEMERCQIMLEKYRDKLNQTPDLILSGCAESAAAKRATLDLSRALTKYRQGKL